MTGPADDAPLDLAAAYALGALSPEETRRFEAFLATSPDAQREVAEYREVAALLALGDGEPAPGPALRARLMARLGQPQKPRRPWLALAASLLLVLGLGAALVLARRRLASLETQLASQTETLGRTRDQLVQRENTLNAILDPGVQLFQLTATGDPEPGIQLFWNRAQHHAIVHGYRLKPVGPGQAYQLWFIQDGKPVPSVTFKPQANGSASVGQVPVPTDGTVSAAAITVEPEAGSAQPTSPIVLVGTLQKS
jgi:anti-sigma-K factor RskA